MMINVEVMCVTGGCERENVRARVPVPELVPGVMAAVPDLRCSVCQCTLIRIPPATDPPPEGSTPQDQVRARLDQAYQASARLYAAIKDFERFEAECSEAMMLSHPTPGRMTGIALEQLAVHGRSSEGGCLAGCVVDEPDNGLSTHGWPCPAELVAAAVLGIREPGIPS